MGTKMTELERLRDARNLNPHKPAVAAMCIWGARYASQRGGSMDFWDTLSESEKDTARRVVARIENADEEPATANTGRTGAR